MAAIDIGPGATNRTSNASWVGYTVIELGNPADGTGTITVFEVWTFNLVSGVVCGTFSGSGTSHTSRDSETLGNVTSGSKQTFSGLNCDVTTGDLLGWYCTGGDIELDTTGGSGVHYILGNQFGAGAQTYTNLAGYVDSLYGTGATAGGTSVTVSTLDLKTASQIISVGYGCFVPVSSLYLTPNVSIPNFGYPIPAINLKTTGQISSLEHGLYVPTVSLKLNNQIPSLGYGISIPITSLKLNPYTSNLQVGIAIPQIGLKTGLTSSLLGFSYIPITVNLNTSGETPTITVAALGITLTPDTIALILNSLIPHLFGGDFIVTVSGRYGENPTEIWVSGLTSDGRYASSPNEAYINGLTKAGRYG